MTVEQALIRLKELAEMFPREECPWEDRPTFEPRTDEKFLEEMRKKLGKALPDDLLAFFRICDAVVAMSIHNGYWIGGAEQLIRSAARGDFVPRIENDDVFPIATDGGGNAFLISAEVGSVWHWKHETGATRLVATLFGQFLERVVADWEHFAVSDDEWSYLV
jgi:hypothetical protein